MAATGFTVRALSISRTGALFLGSLESSSRYRLWHRLFPRSSVPYRHHFQNGQSSLAPAMAVAIASTPYSSAVVDHDTALANSLLDRLRARQLKEPRGQKPTKEPTQSKKKNSDKGDSYVHSSFKMASSFSELGLTEELLAAIDELGLCQPTEVQCRSIPAVLDGDSVVVASHTGSGKTLAYMLPIVQLLRQEEIEQGKAPRPRRPRAVVLCPTRELAEQVYRVAKSICHHARFRTTLIGGGVRMRPQEDALNAPIDMLVGTPGRLLKHIEDKNMAYGDIKYVVLDEADTMFDRGFGPDVKQFLGPLRNRAQKSENAGFQTILVTATITKAVQNLLDDEFPGIKHIRTSTLHKKVSTARHGFIKLAGTENKLESLLQVLEPSLSKGERVMVFCNTLNSCRAVDHFLNENNIPTVNYHGAVPAEERVEVLEKFREQGIRCPALVCTDLAARGLDLVVDHVIMFDFPLNSIDYLHRTGRTARMGARGKITSLVTRRSSVLAEQIESAIQKGETLEGISAVRKEPVKDKRPVVKKELKTRRAAIKPSKQFSQRLKSNSKLSTPKVDSKGTKKAEKIGKLTVSKPAFKLAKGKSSSNPRTSKATKRLGQKSSKRA